MRVYSYDVEFNYFYFFILFILKVIFFKEWGGGNFFFLRVKFVGGILNTTVSICMLFKEIKKNNISVFI